MVQSWNWFRSIGWFTWLKLKKLRFSTSQFSKLQHQPSSHINYCRSIKDNSEPVCIYNNQFETCNIQICQINTNINEGARHFPELINFNNNLQALSRNRNLPALRRYPYADVSVSTPAPDLPSPNNDEGRRSFLEYSKTVNSGLNHLKRNNVLQAAFANNPAVTSRAISEDSIWGVDDAAASPNQEQNETFEQEQEGSTETSTLPQNSNKTDKSFNFNPTEIFFSTSTFPVSSSSNNFQFSSNQPDRVDCKYSNQPFRGKISTTKNGYTCQKWDAGINPATIQVHRPNYRPDENDRDHNYCRNPDDDANGAWCYTTSPDVRYDYCEIPRCENLMVGSDRVTHSAQIGILDGLGNGQPISQSWEDSIIEVPEPNIIPEEIQETRNQIQTSIECLPESDPTGIYYMGKRFKTKTGNTCQNWDIDEENAVHIPKYIPDNPALHKNYCRNPDQDSNGLWCYTTNPNVRFEYCEEIPRCRPNFMTEENTTLGAVDSENSSLLDPSSSGNTRYRRPAPVAYPQPAGEICGRPKINPAMIDTTYRRRTRQVNPTDRTRRIYNGHMAEEGMHPWIALVRSTTDTCGGTIISAQFILTAAHCCWDNMLDMEIDRSNLMVYAGMGSRLDDWRHNPNIQRKLVNKVIVHNQEYVK